MRTVASVLAAAFILALSLVPNPVLAESARLGVSAGYGGWTGDDFDHLEAGYTFGLEALFTIGHRLFVGPAFDLSWYSLTQTNSDVLQPDLNAVLRYYLPSQRRRFFLGGLLGWSWQTAAEDIYSLNVRGVLFGATAGISLPLGQSTADLSVTADYHLYGEAKLGAESIPGSDRSGVRFLVRLGLGFPWGLVED